MKKRVMLMFVVGMVFIAGRVFAADTYKIDPVHSTIGFSIKHMMVSQVTGQFDQYEGAIVYDPSDLDHAQINVTIQAPSINTHVAKRDDHLRSADFFDADQFPAITFVSKKITSAFITGDLTIKGVTKEVSIPATIAGPVKTPSGSMVIGITGSLTLNRQDYGIKWNKTLDQGGVTVGDEVTVNINVEAQKKEPPKQEATTTPNK